jgi:hypothetical protein
VAQGAWNAMGLPARRTWMVVGSLYTGSRTIRANVMDRHLMTGVGAYFYIVWGIWLRHYLNYRQDEFELVWPNLWTMPEVVQRSSPANGHSGRDAKKKR